MSSVKSYRVIKRFGNRIERKIDLNSLLPRRIITVEKEDYNDEDNSVKFYECEEEFMEKSIKLPEFPYEDGSCSDELKVFNKDLVPSIDNIDYLKFDGNIIQPSELDCTDENIYPSSMFLLYFSYKSDDYLIVVKDFNYNKNNWFVAYADYTPKEVDLYKCEKGDSFTLIASSRECNSHAIDGLRGVNSKKHLIRVLTSLGLIESYDREEVEVLKRKLESKYKLLRAVESDIDSLSDSLFGLEVVY